jgi:hypothetical protein
VLTTSSKTLVHLSVAASAVLLGLLCSACGGIASAVPTPAARPGTPVAGPRPSPSPVPAKSPTPRAPTAPAFLLIRAPQITAGAHLNFQGQGFLADEQATVTIETTQGETEATLEPVTISKDGNLDEVSVVLPDGIGRGDHFLHAVGVSSNRSARARFSVVYVAPKIVMDTYSVKSNHTFGFTGSGFAPGEVVEVRIGGLGGSPLATFPADAVGNVSAQSVPLPLVQAGDYTVYFVGQQSRNPVSVGFNIQGFTPWVVLDSYSLAPYSMIGFRGQDFVPGDPVEVYLDVRDGEPLLRIAADADGQLAVQNAFTLPDVLKGDHQLLFLGKKSGANISAKFVVLPFSPGLELTNYAGRPGTRIAFNGDGWARNETLDVLVGEGRSEVVTFQSDATGAFTTAGLFRLPVGTVAGGVPLTVRGEVSQAEVTVWYQALELKPSAELTAYHGPPGTVVSFTGRSFAGDETVHVHLEDRGGPELGAAVATDDGTVENIGAYPIVGNWGDDIHFVLVGESSHAEGATDFKIANPDGPQVPASSVSDP